MTHMYVLVHRQSTGLLTTYVVTLICSNIFGSHFILALSTILVENAGQRGLSTICICKYIFMVFCDRD